MFPDRDIRMYAESLDVRAAQTRRRFVLRIPVHSGSLDAPSRSCPRYVFPVQDTGDQQQRDEENRDRVGVDAEEAAHGPGEDPTDEQDGKPLLLDRHRAEFREAVGGDVLNIIRQRFTSLETMAEALRAQRGIR